MWVSLSPDGPFAIVEDPQLNTAHKDVDMDVSGGALDGCVGGRRLEGDEGVRSGTLEVDDLLLWGLAVENKVQHVLFDAGSGDNGQWVSLCTQCTLQLRTDREVGRQVHLQSLQRRVQR